MATPLERALLLTERITDQETRAAMRELIGLIAELVEENRRMRKQRDE